MIAPTPFFGDRGCHVRILEEAMALGERGVQVSVLTYPAGNDVDGVEVRRSRNVFGLSRERIGPEQSSERPIRAGDDLAARARRLRNRRPDE